MLPVENMPEPFCLGCGYDLTGTPDGRCSECGRRFDRALFRRQIAEKQIPTGTGMLMLAAGPLFFLTLMLAALLAEASRQTASALVSTGILIGIALSVAGAWQVATRISWLGAVMKRRVPGSWDVLLHRAAICGCMVFCQGVTLLLIFAAFVVLLNRTRSA